MVALVTQEEAMRQLRLNAAGLSAEEILDVMFKAEQASAIVVDYLKRPWADDSVAAFQARRRGLRVVREGEVTEPAPVEPWTEATTPLQVKTVILAMLTALYDGRTPQDELLSQPLKDIIHRLRDPALA